MVLPKLSECSVAELEEMAKAINVEMVKREDERFKTLLEVRQMLSML